MVTQPMNIDITFKCVGVSVLSIYSLSISHLYHFSILNHHDYEDFILHIVMLRHFTIMYLYFIRALRRYRRYRRYRIDTDTNMYKTQAIKIYFICTRHLNILIDIDNFVLISFS